MRKFIFSNDSFYHIFSRGILKNNIFLDRADYARFVHSLYEFNISKKAATNTRRLIGNVRGDASNIWVDIVCYCCMPNHFHLILKQKIDSGIYKFMHKLLTGYAMYFNKKHDRQGILFEKPFKAITVESDEYMMHLSRYIHLNPLSLYENDQRENSISDRKGVNNFLEDYKWSSYSDYIGQHNFPSVINKEPIICYFKNSEEYKKFINEGIATKNIENNNIEALILE